LSSSSAACQKSHHFGESKNWRIKKCLQLCLLPLTRRPPSNDRSETVGGARARRKRGAHISTHLYVARSHTCFYPHTSQRFRRKKNGKRPEKIVESLFPTREESVFFLRGRPRKKEEQAVKSLTRCTLLVKYRERRRKQACYYCTMMMMLAHVHFTVCVILG